MLMRRLVYRQFLSRLYTSSGLLNSDQANAIKEAWLRPRVFNLVVDELDMVSSADGLDATAVGDGKLAIWLWEHREEILAFIVKVIETFKPIFGG